MRLALLLLGVCPLLYNYSANYSPNYSPNYSANYSQNNDVSQSYKGCIILCSGNRCNLSSSSLLDENNGESSGQCYKGVSFFYQPARHERGSASQLPTGCILKSNFLRGRSHEYFLRGRSHEHFTSHARKTNFSFINISVTVGPSSILGLIGDHDFFHVKCIYDAKELVAANFRGLSFDERFPYRGLNKTRPVKGLSKIQPVEGLS